MKRTTDSKTKSKLDTELEPTSPKKTVELKFTDYSINKFKPNYNGKKKVSEKIIDSGIKGLKLNCIKSTGNKYLIQQFWFNGKADLWTVGEFRLGIFGIKECRTKAVEIMKTHTDDNGMWIKSPKITIKDRRERIKKAELQKRQMLTIRQCIEKLYEANLPKARTDGTLTAKSFVSKTDAKRWATLTETKLRRDDAGISSIKFPKFDDVARRYIEEISVLK